MGVESAKAIYSAGFFLTVSVDSMLKVGKYCAANNKTYCLNLSAPFLIQFFKEQMMSVMPYADIVFGNETEALTFAETFNLGKTDIKKIALAISMLPKENGSKGRLVIITQGSDPVICVENGEVLEFKAEKLPAENQGHQWSWRCFCRRIPCSVCSGSSYSSCCEVWNLGCNTHHPERWLHFCRKNGIQMLKN